MFSRLIVSASFLLFALTGDLAKAQTTQPKEGPQEMKFVALPKGTFYMGWDGQKGSAKKTEIKADFEIGVYTVTQGQWQALMGKNPSSFSRNGGGKDKVKSIKDEDLKLFPVDGVSWDDCQEFLKKLNEKQKGKGWVYRLPSEAEWEYACRGGATSEKECSYHFYFAKPTNDPSSKQANFEGRFPAGKGEKGPWLNRTAKVGSYAPNTLGLYDMHGNVAQWCDSLQEGQKCVLRGGDWNSIAQNSAANAVYSRVASQRGDSNGVRLVRIPAVPADK